MTILVERPITGSAPTVRELYFIHIRAAGFGAAYAARLLSCSKSTVGRLQRGTYLRFGARDLLGVITACAGRGLLDPQRVERLRLGEVETLPNEEVYKTPLVPLHSPHAIRRRERIIGLLLDGRAPTDITRDLVISRSTLKRHLAQLYNIYGVNNYLALVAQITFHQGKT